MFHKFKSLQDSHQYFQLAGGGTSAPCCHKPCTVADKILALPGLPRSTQPHSHPWPFDALTQSTRVEFWSFGEHGSADMRQQQTHQHIFPHHIIVTQTAMASRHPAKLSVRQGCAHHLPRNVIQVQGVVQVNIISMANVLRRLL